MPRKLLIPIRKFLRVLDYMGRIGLDPDAMAMALGYTQQELQAMPSDQLLPGSDYSRMYKDAVRQMETLRRPIPWAAGIGSEAHELMCHCIIGCKTLGEALDIAQRFDKLTYPLIGYRMRVERTDSQFELHYQVRTDSEGSVFAPEDWDRAPHYEAVARASGLLIWYGFCGWLIGRSFDLEGVQIAAPHVSDAYRDSLVNVFHCPLQFDSADNKFVAPLGVLERRLVHTPASLEEFLNNAVFGLITLNSRPSSTTAAIRSLIKLDFSEGIPSFEQMAENLHMSESSLRRRLLKEETSYQNIKDQVRCEIALEHLRREDTRINDLAELLGFTEPSSFGRSFRGWMGVTPKVYRDSLKPTG
ncbi:MAG: AraC family transcriptional regulator ligand-binding domain-containing protein [Gammaproteobacteria bacterium]|nr:AraC family transcriptional regulator ligand-binding domain-containing protein [Gammaproteobacteria bacterium]